MTWNFIRKYRCLTIRSWKRWWRKTYIRNFDTKFWHQKWENWKRCSVTSCRGLRGIERRQGVCNQWKGKGQCSRGDQCSFRHDSDERAKSTPKTAPSSEPPTQRGVSSSRKRNLRGWSPSGKINRQPCRDFLKGTCTKLPCDYWHPSECQFYKSESGCKFGNKCSFPHRKVAEQPKKSRTLWWQKSSVFCERRATVGLCIAGQPPKSSTILRSGSKVLGPIRRVRFTRATLRHANILENKGPSLKKIKVKVSHQRSPSAMKFEDRSQEETERQERCARGDAWRLAKNIF